jgi:hypothetical protein
VTEENISGRQRPGYERTKVNCVGLKYRARGDELYDKTVRKEHHRSGRP